MPRGKPFVKGEAKGRPKGVDNKVNREAKELFMDIMSGQIPHVQEALSKLHSKPEAYLNCLSKLMPYFLTKRVDVTTDGDKITSMVLERTIVTKSDNDAKKDQD